MPEYDAVPVKLPLDAGGNPIPMEEGECLWCGQWVVVGRDIAGSTDPQDPAWHIDGDFGCDESPETNEEGVGDHARPYDLARLLQRCSHDWQTIHDGTDHATYFRAHCSRCGKVADFVAREE